MLLLPLATLAMLLAQAPATDPRALSRATLLAVEGDAAGGLRSRWASALRRDPQDRPALFGMGTYARLTYDYAAADSLLWHVIELRGDDVFADYARMEQGAALLVRGRMREAADAYSAALSGAMRRADTIAVAEALLGLAGPRARLAVPAEALALLHRAAALVPHDTSVVSSARCQQALLYSRMGRPEARSLAEGGVAMARAAGNRRQEGRCYHAIAQTATGHGEIDSAAAALGVAADLFERTRDRAALASTLQWRGYLFITIGRPGDAYNTLTRAVAEGERSGAMSAVSWAQINLGMVALGLGDRLTATRHLTLAIGLLEAQGDNWGLVTARSVMGGVAVRSRDMATAREAYGQSLAWGERVGHVQTQFTSNNALASIAIYQRQWDEAARYLAAARRVARTGQMTGWERGLQYGDGLLALRRRDFASAERNFKGYLAVVDTLQRSTRYQTRTLLAEVYARRGAIAAAEAELAAASDEMDRWRASLSERDLRVRALDDSEYGNDPDLGVATILAALVRAGRVDAAFRFAERRRARELTDLVSRAAAARPGAPATTPQGAAQRVDVAAPYDAIVDDSTALLEYVTGRGGEPTLVFIVTRAGVSARELPSIDSLDADARRFVTLLEGGGDIKPLAARLGAALLGPVGTQLDPAITRLIVIPDDVLARLPFDALVLPDGRFAVERFAVAVAPSAATVVALRGRPANADAARLLAFGDPAFEAPGDSGDAGTATFRSAFGDAGGLGRLRSSAGEARRAARYAPNSVVRLRGDASESYLRTTPLGAFRVLHFATHALVDEQSVLRSALALAPGDGYDGFLGPADLAALSLRADVVVLSACRTAGGEVVGGEGVLGLTGPILQAGARAIVATQWRIADTGTVQVVDGMYRALAAGRPVIDALRQAKLAALRAGAPASEWAAFVAVGDPLVQVPLVVPDTERDWGLALGIGLATLLVAALAAYRWTTRKRLGAEAA